MNNGKWLRVKGEWLNWWKWLNWLNWWNWWNWLNWLNWGKQLNWEFVKSNLCCCVEHSKNPPSPESFRD